MIKPIHNSPAKGKLRVIGYASGSGNTLWKVLELQKELEKTYEGSPFEVVGIFSDNPNSKGIETAKKYGFPYASLDIREYYKQKDKPLKDRQVRAEYDKEVMDLIKPFGGDTILLAGYVWATTDVVLDNYTMINVHPADLSIVKEGRRAYAGANGVGDALKAGENYICSSSHLATKELDGGPLLIISPKVIVDYSLHENQEERMKYYLKLVNEQSRYIGARTILEIALGNFEKDEKGKLYYKGSEISSGYRIESWNENKPMHERNIGKLINPENIAVIGASAKPGIGQAVVKNIIALGNKDKVFAINRKGEDVLGAKGYISILDIPEEIDMAVITVPSASVLDVARECGEKGVKALVCVSAGFKEVGGAGIENEFKLMDIVNKYNMRMLGPNCMGVLNTSSDSLLNATILHNIPDKGGIAFVTQSGALGAGMLDFAENLNLGFSFIASLGNQPDININDLLPMLAEDDHTKVILMYLESIPEPYRFAKMAKRAAEKKPVIIIKAGRTSAGAAAASSHTGSLAGNDKIADALIQKSGAIRAETLEDAFNLASALSKMPRMKGNKVGIITNAGGPGILLADALGIAGFEVPELREDLRTELAKMLFPEASTKNPIDVVAPAPPEHYALSTKAMIESHQYDALLVVCVPPATVDTGKVGEAVANALDNISIPILSCFFGPTIGKGGQDAMRKAGIPTFTYPEQLAHILDMMREDENSSGETNELDSMIYDAKLAGEVLGKYNPGQYLSLDHCEKVLSCYNIQMASSAYIRDLEEIQNTSLKYPIVAKIDHPEIIHKSDVGGVILNINDKESLISHVQELFEKFKGARGIQLQEQLPQGLELIVGAASDSQLGHSVMVGLGGTLVEVFKDIRFGHVPLEEIDIDRMLRNLKCYPILEGYRGKPGIDIKQLKQLIMNVNHLLLDYSEIEELDLNPVIYISKGNTLKVADARIKIGK